MHKMKLQDQVTSLELSRKLKKLGVKQESIWYWYCLGEDYAIRYRTPSVIKKGYSAFTVAELGEMLKKYPESEFVKLPEEIHVLLLERSL